NKVENTYVEAIISASKSVKHKGNVSFGDALTYTITIINDGDLKDEVTLKDVIPEGTVLVGNVDVREENGSRKITGEELAKGTKLTVEKRSITQVVFTTKVEDMEDGSKISNIANVDGKDTNKVENTFVKPIISATKTSSTNGKVRAGDIITYKVTVTNSGSAIGTAIIKDTVPAGTELVEGSITLNDKNITLAEMQNENSTIINVPASGGVVVLKFDVKVKEVKEGTKITNVASVNELRPSVTNEVVVPHIDCVKTSNKENQNVVFGDEITYKIKLKNIGFVSGTVNVADTVPSGTVLVGNIKKGNQIISQESLAKGIQVIVPANKEVIVEFTVKVSDLADKTVIRNEAVITGDVNAKPSTETTVTRAHITSNKTSKIVGRENVETINNLPVVIEGDTVEYNISVTNDGSLDTNVVIEDKMLSEKIVEDSIKIGEVKYTKEQLANGIIVNVPKNSNVNLTFSIKAVDFKDEEIIKNIATIKVPNEQDQKPETTNIFGKANVNVEKQSTLTDGNKIAYKIVATNTGSIAGNINLSDKIPANTKLVEGSITHSGILVENNTKIDWGNVAIKSNETQTFEFNVIVDSSVAAGTVISNKASEGNEVKDTVEDTILAQTKTETIKATNIVLVMDLSSSMNNKIAGYKSKTRLELAKDAANKFIDKVYSGESTKDVTVSLVTFNTEDEKYLLGKVIPYTGCLQIGETVTKNNKETLKNEIKDINIGAATSGYGTHIRAGLDKANEVLGNVKTAYPNNENVVVFLGDGNPTIHYKNNKPRDIYRSANEIKNSAKLYTIGFAVNQNDNDYDSAKTILSNMATTKQDAYLSGNGDDLINAFNSISSSVANNTKPIKYTSVNGNVSINEINLQVDENHNIVIYDGENEVARYASIASAKDILTYNKNAEILNWNLSKYSIGQNLKIVMFTK
ncbi:MAG: VWA domain-containing protein, partial [Clostridia bacterium]